MKSVKKRFKKMLGDIDTSATELAALCMDLTLLIDIQEFTTKVLTVVDKLKLQCSKVSKEEFSETILASEALAELEELIDTDVISTIEERFFSTLNYDADHPVGLFLQQVLNKIENRHKLIIAQIQQLLTVCTAQE
ncbi:hypothetical protein [Methylomonas sp. AM2-LC]|uniref:hypothetical protein n=1 Tax=Methylomonas sp. AM2-LC TaxID=3153301 RepID=UPI0032668188